MLPARLTEDEIRRAADLGEGGDRVVDGVSTLESAADRCLYFVNWSVSPELRAAFAARPGSILLVPPGSGGGDWGESVVLEVENPRRALARVLAFIRSEQRVAPLVRTRAIHANAAVSPLAVLEGGVEIGEGAILEPFCVIGPDVRIGAGTIVRSGVRIFPRVEIGASCEIGANSVIGHDGYGFTRNEEGNKFQIPHLGGVVIGASVSIGALTTVQGGMILPTTIEDHAKLGEQIAVGHSARIGRNASLTGGILLGGGSVVAADAWVGLNVSIREGVRVGEQALVGMDASVQEDLPDDSAARAPRPDVSPRSDPSREGIGFPREWRGPER